ncbi:MAG: hypothetical protein NT173_12725 [Opitutales bacterium]|nr:hypothetical protein [Opitutales bacterium]
MKKILTPFVALAALLLVTGCETTGAPSRIQEKSAVFDNLAPWQQRDIQDGVVGIGYSTDMVYMAIGKPSKIVTTANGQETVWTYNNYYPSNVQSKAQMVINNTAGGHYASGVESSSSPRSNKSLSDTGTRGTAQASLDVPDLPSDTLYVIFREGQVYQTKLESENR